MDFDEEREQRAQTAFISRAPASVPGHRCCLGLCGGRVGFGLWGVLCWWFLLLKIWVSLGDDFDLNARSQLCRLPARGVF